MEAYFAIRDIDSGKLVALDEASGGYPVLVNTLKEAKIWPTFGAMCRYADIFCNPNRKANPKNWEPIMIHISFRQIGGSFDAEDFTEKILSE